MATRIKEQDEPRPGEVADPGHDAWVCAKVEKALAQSRDRTKIIPIEQVWRDFDVER